MGAWRVSVVVPAINEAGYLPGLLADLSAQQSVAVETIVADGGSRDGSRAAVEAAGARWLECEAGRGRQMNTGAAAARYDRLLFLHADCRLSDSGQLRAACERLTAARADSRPLAGHFALRFVDADNRRFLFRYMAAKTASGRRYTINGDQGLLIDRAEFEALGGFDTSLGYLEDQRMAETIRAAGGRFCRLPGELITSARRFQLEGPRRRYLLMALIMAMYIADAACFFERAPAIYTRQDRAGRLALGPYVALIGAMAWRRGFVATLGVAWRVAGLILGQCWQLWFALDVWRAGDKPVDDRLTRGYERYCARFIEQPVARTVVLMGLGLFVVGPALVYAVFWRALRGTREIL